MFPEYGELKVSPLVCLRDLFIFEGGNVSEVIAGIILNEELLIFIDFDRPVWKNSNYPGKSCIPTLDNFVVDGILGATSNKSLIQFGLPIDYIGSNFSEIELTSDLASARNKVYQHVSLPLTYIHAHISDVHIERDLAKFASQIIVNKISEDEFQKIARGR